VSIIGISSDVRAAAREAVQSAGEIVRAVGKPDGVVVVSERGVAELDKV